jgi:hypothetical protein
MWQADWLHYIHASESDILCADNIEMNFNLTLTQGEMARYASEGDDRIYCGILVGAPTSLLSWLITKMLF